MSKQRATNNGIDYTPRRLKAIQEANQRPMERHVHGVVQRQQHYPLFEVTAAGKTVEWTESRGAAHSAFANTSALPKRLFAVHEDGRRVLLDQVSATGRRMGQPELLKQAA